MAAIWLNRLSLASIYSPLSYPLRHFLLKKTSEEILLLLHELKLYFYLIFRLATDLQLQEYQLHYWKDFPDNCFLQTSESASQIRQVGSTFYL